MLVLHRHLGRGRKEVAAQDGHPNLNTGGLGVWRSSMASVSLKDANADVDKLSAIDHVSMALVSRGSAAANSSRGGEQHNKQSEPEQQCVFVSYLVSLIDTCQLGALVQDPQKVPGLCPPEAGGTSAQWPRNVVGAWVFIARVL